MGKIKEIFGVVGGRRDDDDIDDVDKEIERETNNELRDELRRAKLAKVRTYRIKNELRAKKLSRMLEEEGGGLEEESDAPKKKKSEGVNIADVEVAKELSKMPEEEQKRVLAMVSLLKSTPSPSSQANLLLPLMLMYSGQAGSSKPSELDVFEKSLIVAKEIAEGQGSQKVDVSAIMKNMVETIKALRTMDSENSGSLVSELAKRTLQRLDSPPPKSFIEEVLEDEKKQNLINRLFGSKVDKEVLEIQRQIENDKRKWELMLRKLDYEMKLRTAQLMNESRKGDMIQSGLKQVVGAFTQALAEQGGQPQAGVEPYTPPKPQPQQVQNAQPKGKLSTLKCDRCGVDIRYLDSPSVNRVVCPSCGMVYVRDNGSPSRPVSSEPQVEGSDISESSTEPNV